MNCSLCTGMLNEYLEGSLNEEKSNEIKEHLEQCPLCKEELDFLKDIVYTALQLSEEPPKELKENVLEAIKQNEKRGKIILFKRTMISVGSAVAGIVILFSAYHNIFAGFKSINKASMSLETATANSDNNGAVKEDAPQADTYIAKDSGNGSQVMQASMRSESSVASYKYVATFKGKSTEKIKNENDIIFIENKNNSFIYKTKLSSEELRVKLLGLGFTQVLNLEPNKEETGNYTLQNGAEYAILTIVIE